MPLKGWHPPDVRPFAYEELTVTNASAIQLVGPNGSLARFDFAWVELATANVRMRLDGTAPTTTVGHQWTPGMSDLLTFLEVQNLRVIAEGADALLRVTYYRQR